MASLQSIPRWHPNYVVHATVMMIVTLSAFALVGCGPSGPQRGRVHGSVSFDGKPVAEGQIRFFALDGGIGADGPIHDGKYDIPMKEGMSAGTYRVEVSSAKKTGKKIPDRDGGPGDMKEEIIETLPSKYNQNSELKMEYDATSQKPHDFDLKK